jgi:hypothetical protein
MRTGCVVFFYTQRVDYRGVNNIRFIFFFHLKRIDSYKINEL